MLYVLCGVIIILQIVALRAFHARPAPIVLPAPVLEVPIPPSDESITAALSRAFVNCGLNSDHFHEDFNLLHTGKLGNILFHASEELGHPIQTVRDLHDLLVK